MLIERFGLVPNRTAPKSPLPSPLCAEVLECQVVPVGLDPFRSLKSGVIRLRGMMKFFSDGDGVLLEWDYEPERASDFTHSIHACDFSRVEVYVICILVEKEEGNMCNGAGIAIFPTGQRTSLSVLDI